jgi:hypothetical protein
MKSHIQDDWKSELIKTDVSDKSVGWLNNKWKLYSFEYDASNDADCHLHIVKNIAMISSIIKALPATGTSRGVQKRDIHQCRIYAVVGQKGTTLPCFQEGDVQRVRMTKFKHFSDVGRFMACLSMEDRMYGEECKLIGWSATKFDEGPLSGYICMDFYIKGDRQLLYNELKWYMIDELVSLYPNVTYQNKYDYVKYHLPSEAIYYNVVHDKKGIICELKGRIQELKDASVTFTSSEKNDIRASLAYYREKCKVSGTDDMCDMLKQLIA